MSAELLVRIYRQQSLCHTLRLGTLLRCGRQRPGEPAPFAYDAGSQRLIVADVGDQRVSREHLSMEVVPAESGPDAASARELKVTNLSRKRSIEIDQHGRLGPGEQAMCAIPTLIAFEDLAIRVEPESAHPWQTRSLDHQTVAPGSRVGQMVATADATGVRSVLFAARQEELSSDQLAYWLGAAMEVLQSAAGASDYLEQAVDAVARIVGLDTIAALRLTNGNWEVASIREQKPELHGSSSSRAPSKTILQEVLAQKRTVFHLPAGQRAASLEGVKALVASPILNTQGDVIGAIYGARYSQPSVQFPQISELEATMVEVIACSTAAGIAREVQQEKALAARLQFEQFFTPQLARELEQNPRLLEGQDAEVSILFCDIVGFSNISARIGPALTMEWIGDVMNELSEAVMDCHGVVVDYIGDELMAMWGAPKPQPQHAELACQASSAMLQARGILDQRWADRLSSNLELRIGISSGIASVGNTGSSRRLKYGPLGGTVNLASRLQNAAKFFGVDRLISEQTADLLSHSDSHAFRPLGSTQLVNLPGPVPVYHLMPVHTDTSSLCRDFSEIVAWCEQRSSDSLERAIVSLKELADRFPSDVPTQLLLKHLTQHSLPANCLWHLSSK